MVPPTRTFAVVSRLALTGGMLSAAACGLPAQTTQPQEYADVPVAVTTLKDVRIDEASGIVASRRHPGHYYLHNDSGDEPRVFLIDRQGETRATIRLKGVRAVDCEDIAVAPGRDDGTFDVCLADIGDNNARHANVRIYRFPEVALPERAGETLVVEPLVYRLRYAEGPVNAEAFAVHPQTGDGYIFTKSYDGRGSAVYKLPAPWDAARETVLRKVGELNLPPALVPMRVVTGADIRSDGQRLAIRCYGTGWEWRMAPDAAHTDFDQLFSASPVQLTMPPERQGEALCYSADGAALLTGGEGRLPTLWELRTALPTGAGR